jgi:hypothetical protein
MGSYVVSPATHPTGCGRFSASYAVQRAAGDDRPGRVFRLSTTFASQAAARLVAVTQGWLHTSMACPSAV